MKIETFCNEEKGNDRNRFHVLLPPNIVDFDSHPPLPLTLWKIDGNTLEKFFLHLKSSNALSFKVW